MLLLLLLLLLLLFVFNIYILAVFITLNSSVRQVITNEQRITEYSCLYISNTFLSSILAVSNNALFCITPTLHLMPSFPIKLSSSAEILPRAPIITGTISTFLNFYNFWSLFSNPGTFPLSLFLFSLLLHKLVSNINNYALLFFLVNNYQVRLSCLYQIFTLEIYVLEYFDLFILYCSFWSILIPLLTVL